MPESLPSVLFIDDDEDAHFLLGRAFLKSGIRAQLSHLTKSTEFLPYLTGEGQFADRTRFPKPNLVLLDWNMPELSGAGVLKSLAASGRKEFPVVVFSSSETERDVQMAYSLGCDAYVIKPTQFDRLLELVKKIDEELLSQILENPRALSTIPSFCLPGKPRAAPERPRAEKNVPTSALPKEDIFQLIVEQIQDYAIFMLDTSGIICSWNTGARRIQGYEAHEIIGKHFSIFYPPAERELDKPQHELRIAREIGRYEEEGWRVRKDGSRFWANVIVTPIRNASGTISGFAKVTRDLTQRKIQEDNIQRLLESEERFKLLVDQVKDYAIFMLDARGNITSWNQGARRLKGYTADEIIGQHFSMFYTPEDLQRDHPTHELSIAMRDGRYEEEGWRVRKDGSRFWASVVITSVWDKRGNLTGFAKVTRDLTARKAQEDALRQKTRDLENFAHSLSHDLRAPLRSIASYSHILRNESEKLSAEDRAFLHKIEASAGSMDAMISGLLKLSEVSLGDIGELARVEEVLGQTIALLEADIQRSDATVEVRSPVPDVWTSRTLLSQIVSNIVSNAIKFVRPNEAPRVEISVEEKGSDFVLRFKDHGPGIPKGLEAQLFEAFKRGPGTAGIEGSGVGLSIVKKAVDRLGGNIQVRSAEGTEFIVILPKSFPSHTENSAKRN